MTEFELFADALEVADPEERRALLARVCGDDGAMRERVERLLQLHEANSRFMPEPSAMTPEVMPPTIMFNQPGAATSPSGVSEVRPKKLAKDDPTKPMAHELASRGASAPGLGGEHIRGLTHPGSPKLESTPAISGLANFEIEQTIGQGGMGIVLKAHDKKLKRDVAIKVLAPHVAADAEAVQRFLREAQAAAAVRHDNVVTIHAVDEANGIPFLVMELINGESLQDRINRGPLPADVIVQFGIQIASGLEAAHRRGLIHRDIKPANILLENPFGEPERVSPRTTGDGSVRGLTHPGSPSEVGASDKVRVKITDFGLARVMSESAITRSGFVAGTPQYMSPEQANGQPLDHRSDLFSLGSVLYSLCTGQAAFHAESAIVVLRRVTDHEPVPIRSLNPEIPDWLCEVIAKLMAKQPEDRIQTAKEVADLLTRCQANVAITAPRDEPRATDAQSTMNRVTRSDQWERGDEPTTAHTLPIGQSVPPDSSSLENSLTTERLPASSIAPQGSSRGPMTATLKRMLIAVSLLVGVVLAVIFGRGRDPRSQASRGASAPGSSAAEAVGANEVRGLTLPGSPGADGGSPHAEGDSHDAAKAPPRAIAPFSDEQARQHQEAWAAHLKLPVEVTNSIGMKFRLIPPGEFLMGSTLEEIEAALKVAAYPDWREKIVSEGPQHQVILTKPIYVGVTEVTQSQFEQVMGNTPSFFSATGRGKEAVTNLDTGNHPVESVSWFDAAEFCTKLSQQEIVSRGASAPGQSVKANADARDEPPGADAPRHANTNASSGYRLPTEAEWEFACRAGTTTRFWSGDQDQDLIQAGKFVGNSGGRPHPVGELKANPFGLSDVHGNVWEWVQDSWNPAFYEQFQETAAIDPSSPFSAEHNSAVFRGGNWNSSRSECRSSFRLAFRPAFRPNYIGFRVVLAADAVKELLAKTSKNQPPPAVAPFDEKQAKAHQEKWAMHLGVPVEYENSIGMKFRLLPPGEFLMGSTPEEIEAALNVSDPNWREHIVSEGPQHKVILTKPIYVGVTEVTQTQYQQVMGATPSHFSATGKGNGQIENLETGNHPVEMVSWNDAAEFCAKLSQQEKRKPFYSRSDESITMLEGTGYRLPTEAEWEYACRAGTTTRFWSGDQDQDLISAGWHSGNADNRTHAAGESTPNPFGLSDMHGNVWEWVQDGWDPAFYSKFQMHAALDPSRPFLADQDPRPLRGGDYHSAPFECRSAMRLRSWPTWQRDNMGFRVVLPVAAVRQAVQ